MTSTYSCTAGANERSGLQSREPCRPADGSRLVYAEHGCTPRAEVDRRRRGGGRSERRLTARTLPPGRMVGRRRSSDRVGRHLYGDRLGHRHHPCRRPGPALTDRADAIRRGAPGLVAFPGWPVAGLYVECDRPLGSVDSSPFPGPGKADRISPNGGLDAVWSKDGRELFYVSSRQMMAVRITAGAALDFSTPVALFESSYLHRPNVALAYT